MNSELSVSRGVKILLVDSNRDRQSLLRTALAEMPDGTELLTAPDGRTAIELARGEDPDVVLVDIAQPEACAVCRNFKEDNRLTPIPVLFLTTSETDRDSRRKAVRAGAEGFLGEPFDEIELAVQIQAMSKIKAAAVRRRQEPEALAGLVAERTGRLERELAERRRVEQALSESESRYRRITEGLADYQYTVRLEGGEPVETVHSPACLFITGYSSREFAADPYLWLDMVTPDDRDMLLGRVQQVLAGQDIGPIEHKIIKKDGTVRWVSDNIVLNRDEAGVLRSYDGIVKDITERKQVEAINEMLLRETQDRYHEIAALMRASRAVLENPDFTETAGVIFAECRRQLEAQAGFITLRSDETATTEVLLFDSTFTGTTLPDRKPLVVAGLRAEAYLAGKTIFTNKAVQRAEIDFLASGKEAAANMILAPLPVRGKVMGLIGLIDKPGGFTGEDARIATGFGEIAALALAQSRNLESLEKSELRFRSLIETASDAIVSVDGEGRITHWNSGAKKIFGYTAEEAAGGNITLMVPSFMGEADGTFTDRPNGSRLHQSRESREMAGRRKDGSEVPIELTVSRWQIREGVFFTVIIRDISERKQDEQARDKLQAQLNQAQKMEAIGVLAGGIAHDFNNILGAIIGYTEMAREDAGSRLPLADDLDKVLLAAHRAKDLVKQILGFSRQSAVARIPMRILPLIKETLKMLRASIPTTISIKEHLQPVEQAILADPTQVHQIVMNLCSNAAHAMESGGTMTVAVRMVAVDQPLPLESGRLLPGEYVELAVSDTGTGISPEVRDRIFDPYFTTKEVGKGTGMGLSIIHGIIKSYGGGVTVDSVIGTGTTFRVYFPVIQEEEKKEESLPAPSPGKERILFVDDEEVLTRMGKIMLERLGYTVTVYNSSLEALAAFMQDPDRFDLVITDQTMPGMTGIDLSRRLLQLAPGLPIILCTGFSNQVSEESVKQVGIRGFALKPLSKNVIGRLIRKVLQDR